MRVAVLGFDREGKASLEFLLARGDEVTVCDQNTDLVVPDSVDSRLGENYLDNLDTFDLVVRTPGLHPSKILAKNPGILDKITSGTNLFFENCPTKNIVGITGTKGKGTTSTLVTKMLEADGKDVYLGGNIGVPMLSFLGKLTDKSWVVLELSNFQLIDLKYSPMIAAVLMVVPEHLDWHEDMEEYIAAKQQLFIHQKSRDIAIYYAKNEDSLSIADASEGILLPYYEKPGAHIANNAVVIEEHVICDTSDIKLVGEHNWQNVCAAVTTVWQITKNAEAIRTAITSFSGLPFRIEFRKEVNKIRYYNDSFATGPGAATAAISSIEGPMVLIIGGYDRMLNLNDLADTIIKNQRTIRKVVLIGASAERTKKVLSEAGFSNFVVSTAKTMDEILANANVHAHEGDAVVLSPSFASFDMFKDFEDRGKQFNEAVEKL